MGGRTKRGTFHFNSQGSVNWKQWPRSAHQDRWLTGEVWQDPFFSFPVTSNMIWLIFLEIFLAVPLNPGCFPSSLKCTSKNYSSVWRLHRAESAVRSKRIQLRNRQIHYEKRNTVPSNRPAGRVLLTGKGRWRTTASTPRGGETGAAGRCWRAHSIKASDTELDAGHPAGHGASAEMTQGVQSPTQWTESRQNGASSLQDQDSAGSLRVRAYWMVSQNLGPSLPVSARIKEVMNCLTQQSPCSDLLNRILFTKQDL